MIKEQDCRKGSNKQKFRCKIKRFCNRKEHAFTTIGKGLISLTSPIAGTAITTYEIGKSITKMAVCR